MTEERHGLRVRSGLPWLAGGFVVALLSLAAINMWLLVATGNLASNRVLSDEVGGMIAWLAFGLVGAVLTARRPRNLVGWLFVGISLSMVASTTARFYAQYGVVVSPGSLPLAAEMRYLTAIHLLGLAAMPVALLLFPTGRPPTPRWWLLVIWLAICMVASMTVDSLMTASVAPHDIFSDEPLHRSANVPPAILFIGTVGYYGVLGGFPLATVGTVLRFRRARGVERQQMKWFALAALVNIGLAPLAEVGAAGWVISIVALTGIPIAVGLAVLRYRLYDIDRLISRTVAYTLITAVLVAVYVLVAVVPVTLFDLESDLLTAAATLAAAAAFRPVRRRVQAGVDRRFNRSRYDALQTADAFRARLRHTVDLEDLSTDLLSTVGTTVQPARATVWLRPTSP